MPPIVRVPKADPVAEMFLLERPLDVLHKHMFLFKKVTDQIIFVGGYTGLMAQKKLKKEMEMLEEMYYPYTQPYDPLTDPAYCEDIFDEYGEFVY